MVDKLTDLTGAIVRNQIRAAFEAALHDTLDLTPDHVETLYQVFLRKLPELTPRPDQRRHPEVKCPSKSPKNPINKGKTLILDLRKLSLALLLVYRPDLITG